MTHLRSNSSRNFSAKKSHVKIFLYLILLMGHLDRQGGTRINTMWPEENFTKIDFLVPHFRLSWGWCRYAVNKSLFTAYITAKNINFNLKIFVTTPVGPRLHNPTLCVWETQFIAFHEYEGLEWNWVTLIEISFLLLTRLGKMETDCVCCLAWAKANH